MSWIIVNKNDKNLCWSNTFGWCDTTFDSFSDADKREFNLPIGGEWESVSWRTL